MLDRMGDQHDRGNAVSGDPEHEQDQDEGAARSRN
jgi:hypothetical protein